MNWSALKDKHAGQTCLIIGNGPSLKDIPLSFLRKYPSFGTNRIYLMDGFTPTYYACINPLVIEQSAEEIFKLKSEALFLRKGSPVDGDNVFDLVSASVPSFSKHPDSWIYEGFTVTYVCMQLAYYMGFDRVLLVGVDHSYIHDGAPNQELVSKGHDPNHFDPNYFGEGVHWHAPDLRRSEYAYAMADTVFSTSAREIINLTPGTKLDIFEKGDWHDF